MKSIFTIVLAIYFVVFTASSQQTPSSDTEQQLENLTDAGQTETEDDSWSQQMELYRKHPMDLNTAEADELKELKILNDLQIANLLSYRKLLGKFISIYELQAIPAWDVSTIRRILPFIMISNSVATIDELRKRFRSGDHTILLRYSRVLEKSIGYTPTTGSYYLGSPGKLFFRYRYQYKNLLQYGIVGDKDAGEQFFKGTQKYGFDFYSFHLFIKKIGIIQSLAIGDFTVNMGQGLIQWQSIAFRKGVDIAAIKRQSPVLKPYSSAGEYNFHTGAGITVKKGNIEATAFVSLRRINANIVKDTINGKEFFTSFLPSGNNRTQSEVEDRNSVNQFTSGGNISWDKNRFHIGLNDIYYSFSVPLQKRPELYNLYAIAGKSWNNISVDYSYTFRNFHFFGEAAVDKNAGRALVNGLLISADPKVDLSFVYRFISEKYQSINSSAFTENTSPTNETGLYAGISIRPFRSVRLDAYTDFYKFPWLKYLVDAPSYGKDFFAQLTYTPNKQVEIYTRFHNESKQTNRADNSTVTNLLISIPKQNWRTQISYQLNKTFILRNRFEVIWYDKEAVLSENGFLAFIDCVCNPPLKPWSCSFRVQYFDTDGYNSRVYAYENDLLYSYSIPVFSDKGFRYYLNLNYNLNKRFSFWFKWSQIHYAGLDSFGSGLDEIKGKRKNEAKFQIVIFL